MQNHSRKDKLINNSNLDIPSLSIIKNSIGRHNAGT